MDLYTICNVDRDKNEKSIDIEKSKINSKDNPDQENDKKDD